MNLKIHFVGLAVIILLLVAIAYKSSQPDPVPVSPYKIEIVNASFGLNCTTAKQALVTDPYANGANKRPEKNNVLTTVGGFCNGKVTCEFEATAKSLGAENLLQCSKKLEVDYRCFSYDRPWQATADEGAKLMIDCSKRGD